MSNFGKYFCGNMISEYGRKNGRVDYATFSKAFDAVLNNNIMADLESAGYYFDIEAGMVDNSEEIEEEDPGEIYQYYIVSDYGADLIRDYNVGTLFYCEAVDLYIWGISHYGTSWDYVLTSIPCDIDPDARA